MPDEPLPPTQDELDQLERALQPPWFEMGADYFFPLPPSAGSGSVS